MKDYYQILGIRRGASAAEVRRAYRVLVQKLHPDINPDPTAHELIKEVNEAYDVLGDETKKRDYDYRLVNPYVEFETPQQPAHRDPAYKRRSRSHVHVNHGPTQQDMMNRYVHVAVKVFWASALLAAFLLIDFVLPHRVSTETIVAFENTGRRRYEAYYLVTASGQRIKFSRDDILLFEEDQQIEVVQSCILSKLIEMRIVETDTVINNLSTIYANFQFVPWLLGIFSVIGLATKEKVEFRFNLGIITIFVLIFTVFLLIK